MSKKHQKTGPPDFTYILHCENHLIFCYCYILLMYGNINCKELYGKRKRRKKHHEPLVRKLDYNFRNAHSKTFCKRGKVQTGIRFFFTERFTPKIKKIIIFLYLFFVYFFILIFFFVFNATDFVF